MFLYYSFSIVYAFISEHSGRLNHFSRGDNIGLLPFLGCYRCNVNGCSQNSLPFLNHKEKSPRYGNSRKKCTSLAAIARYIMIIFTTGYLQVFKTRYFFHRSIAITTNETTNGEGGTQYDWGHSRLFYLFKKLKTLNFKVSMLI